MVEHVASHRTYLAVYAALIVLTGTTAGIAFVDLGAFNVWIALTIAVTKAALVALFFMHLRDTFRLTWLIAGIGVLWLLIMVVTTMADVMMRGWLGTPGS